MSILAGFCPSVQIPEAHAPSQQSELELQTSPGFWHSAGAVGVLGGAE